MTSPIMLATISVGGKAGGLEKNLIYLCNELISSGEKVVLLTFDLANAETFYELNSEVIWIKVGTTQPHTKMSILQKIRLVRSIRRNIKKYNISKIICFTHGILSRFLLAKLGLSADIICSERNSIKMYDFIGQKKWNINFILLVFAKKITVQFDEYRYDYPIWLRHKIRTVNNPIFHQTKNTDLSSKTILAVGRLATQKRFDLLIRAFATVIRDWPDWHLQIIGEGHLKTALLDLITELGITSSVTITPPTHSLQRYYETSSIFVISSQWEGFPNALAEALSYGMLGVGFTHTAGVNKLISNDQNGILACGTPSTETLSEAMTTLLKRSKEWPTMSAQSKKISTTFSSHNWKNQWKQILDL
jgi:GalNAc-alpha-(1->4)-GalNAc-alpha-(1->3)-diNAcBac-PP-undecaprenol alpha-1,4-N-acetyl-D-galactosaminyltransferase